ncbi:MAG: hypothetical protein DRH08_03145 [Deltaproteobacteria bacterium]|nr:MAG: hypothetical protein DRH08_03145 [Deltaproteobacteria bacterium]
MTTEETKKKGGLFMDKYGDPRGGMIIAAILIAVVGIVVFFGLISEFYQVIQPAHVGLVIKGGELQDETKGDGFYNKMPFWTEIVPVYTGVLSTDEDSKGNFKEEANPFRGIQPLSKDGQVLDIDAQINYSVVDAKLFRETTGSTDPRTIEQLLFVPTLRKLVYDYTSEYGWKGLIQGGERQEFGQRIYQSISVGEVTKRTCSEESKIVDETTGTEVIVEAGCKLERTTDISKPGDYGIAITAVNFKKIKPNAKIIAAVEEAQAKEQEVKIAQQEAAIATEVANKAIEEKRGQTESQKLQANVDAYQIRIKLEEEAAGVKALAEAEKARALALAASQQLVEYKKLEIEMKKMEALVEFGKNSKGNVPSELTIIGTDEANSMSLFYGMANVVADSAK